MRNRLFVFFIGFFIFICNISNAAPLKGVNYLLAQVIIEKTSGVILRIDTTTDQGNVLVIKIPDRYDNDHLISMIKSVEDEFNDVCTSSNWKLNESYIDKVLYVDHKYGRLELAYNNDNHMLLAISYDMEEPPEIKAIPRIKNHTKHKKK